MNKKLKRTLLSLLFIYPAIPCLYGQNEKTNLANADDWFYIEDMKPNDAIEEYKGKLTVGGEAMNPDVNCRVAIYRHGSVIIPHSKDFEPLTVFTGQNLKGESQTMATNFWYTNTPPVKVPAEKHKSLTYDNRIRSFILKKGYMATVATQPDGMGFSQVIVADTGDVVMNELPELLDQKISFIRVMPWQYVSKKGWAGSKWTSVPEGIKYVEEQSDYTNSTWYYNWSASTGWSTNPNRTGKSYNQEFVPEIWGQGSTFEEAYSLEDVSHLMGYNEPDHTEQSNVSVEKAIEEWPYLMQTGLRLGSPATTNFSWLYNFMREAKQRNYRVDYVVIHAYWGGLSGQEWYEKMKTVHETTGRPIWIKEWNNGANWTKESWPSSTADQQAKQLRDLKQILTVMDTCSFIERYSIYNWVQDKRAIILSDGTLTPAGEYYRDDKPDYFFRHDKEVVTPFAVRTAPVLSCSQYSGGRLNISWTDEYAEMIKYYTVEVSKDGKTFTETETVTDGVMSTAVDVEDTENIYIRVKSHPISGSVQTSNTIVASILNNSVNSNPFLGQAEIGDSWKPAILSNAYAAKPIAVLGTPTYRNRQPYSVRMRNVGEQSLDFAIRSWDYQLSPTLAYNDTIALMTLEEGHHQWGSIDIEAKTAEGICSTWKHISFDHPFASVPVVIPTQVSDNFPSASSPRVKNITTEGFDIKLQYEGTLTNDSVPETISYLAAEVGEGTIGGKQVIVGRTEEGAVEDNLLGGTKVEYGRSFADIPLCFAAMQTEADTITSVLRIKSRNTSSVTLIKDREKSAGKERVKGEQVGYILIGNDESVEVKSIEENPSVVPFRIFDLQGRQVDSNTLKGIYLVQYSNGKIEKRLINSIFQPF